MRDRIVIRLLVMVAVACPLAGGLLACAEAGIGPPSVKDGDDPYDNFDLDQSNDVASAFVIQAEDIGDGAASSGAVLTETIYPELDDDFWKIEKANGVLRVEGRRFVDQDGATILLRGWNMSAKIPPYDTHATEESFALLRSWGANVVRLSFTWEAIEPVRGEYQEDYLARMDQLVQWADQNDIWVIVDIHQDAFSRYSLEGCGEGFPGWAVSGEKAVPDNGEACENWGRRMYDDYAADGPMQQEWQAFHANHNGVRDAYFSLIEMLASRYRSQANVIGMDLLNEPFGEYAQIYGLYEEAAGHVRALAPDWILFLSPHAMTSGSLNSVGFGDKPNVSEFALSPHYYDPAIITYGRYQAAGRYMGETDGVLAMVSGWTFPDLRSAMEGLSGLSVPGGIAVRTPEQAVADLNAVAEDWNVPLFIGEFGGPEGALDLEFFLDEFHAAMDELQASGTQWLFAPQWTEEAKDGWNYEDLSSVDDRGGPRRTWRPRPHPQRIAGDLHSVNASYENSGGDAIVLEMSWTQQPALGSTRVYLPRLNDALTLAEQYEISVAGAGAVWTIDEAAQRLMVTSPTEGEVSLSLAYKHELDDERCRIFFKHNGFSCADGVAIEFRGQNALGQQRSFVRYADYPWDEVYDFGEWQVYSSVDIAATRNSYTTVSHSLDVLPELCGTTVTIEGHAWCFGAAWDLVTESP